MTEKNEQSTVSENSSQTDEAPGLPSFNRSRYDTESADRDFLEGQKLLWNGEPDKAQELLEKSCTGGNKLAGILLGQILLSSPDRETQRKAVNLFQEAADAGYPLGTAWLSDAHRSGKGFSKDARMGEKIFEAIQENLEEMAAYGSADAQYFLGFNLLYGLGCAPNPKKAYYWLNKAMEAGHPSAGYHLARMVKEGIDRTPDESQYFRILSRFDNTENQRINYELGCACYSGTGTEEDSGKALEYFLRAAKSGHKEAQYRLGNQYYYGEGTEKDDEKAFEWYSRSADQNFAAAQYALAEMVRQGLGTEKNPAKAEELYLKAAEQEHMLAQYALYEKYLSENNPSQALAWLKKSAENRYAKAQITLAGLYRENDIGLPADAEKFLYWIQRAARSGSTEAKRILADAYLHLDRPDVLEPSVYKAEELLHSAAARGDIQATIDLCSLLLEHPELGASDHQIRGYLALAEQILSHLVSLGHRPGKEFFSLAEFYDSTDKFDKDKAMVSYWKAYQNGFRKEEALCKAAEYHFLKNTESDQLPGDEELLQALRSFTEETDSEAAKEILSAADSGNLKSEN